MKLLRLLGSEAVEASWAVKLLRLLGSEAVEAAGQ